MLFVFYVPGEILCVSPPSGVTERGVGNLRFFSVKSVALKRVRRVGFVSSSKILVLI